MQTMWCGHILVSTTWSTTNWDYFWTKTPIWRKLSESDKQKRGRESDTQTAATSVETRRRGSDRETGGVRVKRLTCFQAWCRWAQWFHLCWRTDAGCCLKARNTEPELAAADGSQKASTAQTIKRWENTELSPKMVQELQTPSSPLLNINNVQSN